MHTFKSKYKTNFIYNSSFSGVVKINKNGKEIIIPVEDILEFIAHCYVLPNKIAKLESMDYKKILKK